MTTATVLEWLDATFDARRRKAFDHACPQPRPDDHL